MNLSQMACILDKKNQDGQDTAYWRMTPLTKLKGKYREARVFALCWEAARDLNAPPQRVPGLRHFIHSFDVDTKLDVLFEVVDTPETLAKYASEKKRREAAAVAAAEALKASIAPALVATPSNTIVSG